MRCFSEDSLSAILTTAIASLNSASPDWDALLPASRCPQKLVTKKMASTSYSTVLVAAIANSISIKLDR